MSQKTFIAANKIPNRRPVTTCKEETINHLHSNLGVEILPQLVPDRFGSGSLSPNWEKAQVFLSI
jgi:hypothetical protein